VTPNSFQPLAHQGASSAVATSKEGALGPYLRAIRARLGVVTLITALAVAAAVAIVTYRAHDFEATAQLLVTPLPQGDTTFLGIQLLRDSGEPTRTVRTAATLIDSSEVAQRVASQIKSGYDAKRIRDAVTVGPIGESNLVGVTAKANDPKLAALIANTFARTSLDLRLSALRAQFAPIIADLRRSRNQADERAVVTLRRIAGRGDPTLALSQLAEIPTDPIGAPDWLVAALSLVAGLVLAVVTALMMERLDRRVRDSSELLQIAPYPVLARVPPLPSRRRRRGRTDPREGEPAVREVFRTLAIQLDQRSTGAATTVLVTSPSSGDGKTTTAINLALALVATGNDVVLIDFDLWRPGVEARLGMSPSEGLVSLLASKASLEELLRPVPLVPSLRVVAVGDGSGDGSLLHALSRRFEDVVRQAAALAAYVVIDTPPVAEVGDALMVASFADELIVVGRAGSTDRAGTELMAELFSRSELEPAGWILLGEQSAQRRYYSEYLATSAGRTRSNA
jgi:Mrp family chromosome partitioning ATPase/capsular polysaccharide biosynthesis protein